MWVGNILNQKKKKNLAAGLRDTQLFDIFENAFQTLEGILCRSILFDKRK
jgi:hypothetical protein